MESSRQAGPEFLPRTRYCPPAPAPLNVSDYSHRPLPPPPPPSKNAQPKAKSILVKESRAPPPPTSIPLSPVMSRARGKKPSTKPVFDLDTPLPQPPPIPPTKPSVLPTQGHARRGSHSSRTSTGRRSSNGRRPSTARRASSKIQQLTGYDIDVAKESSFLLDSDDSDSSSMCSPGMNSDAHLPMLEADSEGFSSRRSSWAPPSPRPTLMPLPLTISKPASQPEVDEALDRESELGLDDLPTAPWMSGGRHFSDTETAGEYHRFTAQLASDNHAQVCQDEAEKAAKRSTASSRRTRSSLGSLSISFAPGSRFSRRKNTPNALDVKPSSFAKGGHPLKTPNPPTEYDEPVPEIPIQMRSHGYSKSMGHSRSKSKSQSQSQSSSHSRGPSQSQSSSHSRGPSQSQSSSHSWAQRQSQSSSHSRSQRQSQSSSHSKAYSQSQSAFDDDSDDERGPGQGIKDWFGRKSSDHHGAADRPRALSVSARRHH
ncbi:hypothetical protein RJ55_05736 [Drechmeria coniospora]|nr:hypothetical protein RJ55_05736 [Drechmeria coniospora]